MLRWDQPSPRADGGLTSLWIALAGPGSGTAPQRTSVPRTSTCTSAPASASSAALSSADCPAPTMATRRPEKTLRSGCWAVWESTPSAAGPLGASREQLGRRVRVRDHTAGDDDGVGAQLLTGGEADLEVATRAREPGDGLVLDVRDMALGEPQAVVDEQVDRDRVLVGERTGADLVAVVEDRGAGLGRGEARGVGRRLEVHPGGHVVPPGGHQVPEHPHSDAGFAQVCGNRKPVGARADHNNVTHHFLLHEVPRPVRTRGRVRRRSVRGKPRSGSWTNLCSVLIRTPAPDGRCATPRRRSDAYPPSGACTRERGAAT